MSILNHPITRRTFLKLNAQIPLVIAGLQLEGLIPAGVAQAPPCPQTAYGSGAYGQGGYGGYHVPIGDVYPAVPDGIVDIQDVTAIATRWRQQAGDSGWDPRFDLDGDAAITVIDIGVSSAHFGETCPQPTRLENQRD
jgi:hypothetical protein